MEKRWPNPRVTTVPVTDAESLVVGSLRLTSLIVLGKYFDLEATFVGGSF